MRVQLLLVAILMVALASPEVLAGRLQGKKKTKKHKHSSTSTSTSTTTTTTTTEHPPSSTTDSDDPGKVLYLDNMDIIKIHLPMPVQHRYQLNHSTTTPPSASPETAPPNPVPSVLPTAPPSRDDADMSEQPADQVEPIDQEEPTDTEISEEPEDEAELTEEPAVSEEPEINEEPTVPGNEDFATTIAVDDGVDAAADDISIPDVATFDAVFSNRSRLSDDIRVFTFGGIYEIIVNRTQNSVDVVMVRHHTDQLNETVPLTEVTGTENVPPRQGLQMMVQGPSTTGLERQQDQQDKRHAEGENNNLDTTTTGRNDNSKKEHNKARHDSRHSKDQVQDDFDAVFINGSALGGIGIGVYSFNSSGTFQLNVSVADDFMTVIISQVSQQIAKDGNAPLTMLPFVWPNSPQGPGNAEEPDGSEHPPTPHRLRGSAPPDYTAEDSDSAVWPVLMLVGFVGAVGTLVGAVVLWRARVGAPAAGFARRGDGEFYGTVEPWMDPSGAAPQYARSQYEPLQ